MAEPVRLRGVLIAPAAREWLEAPPEPRVHSLYRNSVNLDDGRGELLSLVTQDSGPGPFALVVRPESPGFVDAGGFEARLTSRSPVELEGKLLTIGSLRVDWGGAAGWKPRPSWEQVGASVLSDRLSELRELLERHAPPGSFAPLVDPAALEQREGLSGGVPAAGVELEQREGMAGAALSAAAAPARQLLHGLRGRDIESVRGAAAQLAGLGGGVTPSGDDYLLGAIHALWAVTEPAEAERLSATIVSTAALRTNRLSGAWLQAAGRGEAGNEWHVLAVGLASGAPLDEPAEWLIQRGHTSGADALAGFLAAAQVLLEG